MVVHGLVEPPQYGAITTKSPFCKLDQSQELFIAHYNIKLVQVQINLPQLSTIVRILNKFLNQIGKLIFINDEVVAP